MNKTAEEESKLLDSQVALGYLRQKWFFFPAMEK